MKRKVHIELMNFVESMEETVEILKAGANGKIRGKAKVLKWPQGSRTTKEDFLNQNQKENALRAQARTIINMATMTPKNCNNGRSK
jgi:hypothetical protein